MQPTGANLLYLKLLLFNLPEFKYQRSVTSGYKDMLIIKNKLIYLTVILPGWIDSTLDSPDWTIRLNACTVHAVPARIM